MGSGQLSMYCIVLYGIKKVLEIQRTPKIRGVSQPSVILSGHLTQFSTVVHSVRIKQGNA